MCTPRPRIFLRRDFGFLQLLLTLHLFVSKLVLFVPLARVRRRTCILEKPWQVCSYSEAHSVKLMTSAGDEFCAYCRDFLTRVYPNISRIDSSNFNPQDMWSFGCQIGMAIVCVPRGAAACVLLSHDSFFMPYDLSDCALRSSDSPILAVPLFLLKIVGD